MREREAFRLDGVSLDREVDALVDGIQRGQLGSLRREGPYHPPADLQDLPVARRPDVSPDLPASPGSESEPSRVMIGPTPLGGDAAGAESSSRRTARRPGPRPENRQSAWL